MLTLVHQCQSKVASVGTGGVSFSGSIGFGFGFAIVAGGNVSGQIIDCSNYNKCKQ